MTEESDLRRAKDATDLWGGSATVPRLVARRENAVFDIRLPAGRAALRLHRPGSLDAAAIETELSWVEQLADMGVNCPRPIRSRNGRLCEFVGDQAVSAVAWIDAPALSAQSGAGSLDQHRRLGRGLAKFHTAADRLTLCPIPRQTWKRDDLVGDTPRWDGFWRNPALTPSELDFLTKARDVARDALSALDHPDVGLIHADTLRENILDDGARLWLIDFDDSGWGYRGYDLGTALIQQAGLSGLPDRISALASGYGEARPGSADIAAQIPLFMLIRGLVTAGWVVPRVPAGDPRLRIYSERALTIAGIFLNA